MPVSTANYCRAKLMTAEQREQTIPGLRNPWSGIISLIFRESEGTCLLSGSFKPGTDCCEGQDMTGKFQGEWLDFLFHSLAG